MTAQHVLTSLIILVIIIIILVTTKYYFFFFVNQRYPPRATAETYEAPTPLNFYF
jgi:flagellar basal body-associated protein FliL